MSGGVCGGGGDMWQGACMALGTQGRVACKTGGGAVCGRGGWVHGGRHPWQGACMGGGMCGRGGEACMVLGCVWWGCAWRVCDAGETATETGGMLPTGMHSFLEILTLSAW